MQLCCGPARSENRHYTAGAPNVRGQEPSLICSDQPLVIDLSKIDFIDSSGLGALVQMAKLCNDQAMQFLVVGNARVVQTVKLVRLEQFLHLQPDLDTALGSIAA